MTTFFETYKSDIIYALIILFSVIVLRFLTNVIHKHLLKKRQRKHPNVRPKAITWIKRILHAPWLVLGFIKVRSLIEYEEKYAAIQHYFQLLQYVGIVSIATIVGDASTNM